MCCLISSELKIFHVRQYNHGWCLPLSQQQRHAFLHLRDIPYDLGCFKPSNLPTSYRLCASKIHYLYYRHSSSSCRQALSPAIGYYSALPPLLLGDTNIMGVARTLNAKLSPEHYRQHRQGLVARGIVKKQHAPSTKNNINGLKKKWTEGVIIIAFEFFQTADDK